MPSQEVAITISTNTEQAQTSVKSFKAQLREANGELVSMAEKFGSASTEAIAAAKKVAGLKDAIGDAKALSETFNPDKKFVALGGAIQGAVSGFSALQGAQGLFGSESKDLEKTLLKVQSAMALQQGISGVFAAVDSFKLLGNQIKGNVIGAFNGLKSAIGATGIGLLVVGLGLLVANFDKVKQAVMNLIPGLASVGKFFGGIIDRITDFIGITSQASRELAKMRDEADKSLKLNNKYLQQHGDELDKYTKAKIDAKNKYLEAVKDETLSEKDRIELAKRANREITAADKERANDIAKAREDEAEKNAKKQKEVDDKVKSDLKSQQDALKNIIAKTRIDIENDADKTEAQKLDRQRQRDIAELDAVKLSAKDKAEALALINKKYEILNTELEAENKKKKEKEDAEKEELRLKDLSKRADEQTAADLKRIADNKAVEDQIVKDKEAAAKAKLDIDNSTIQAGQQLFTLIAGLDEKNKGLQKAALIGQSALSIASIIANTNVGSSKEVATKGIFGLSTSAILYAKMGISIASVLAATAKGLSALGGGSAGSVGGAGAAASAPSAPILPQASSTTLNQGQVNQIGNVAARAFVVESDVSGQQERIRRLNRAARIS
jgi:hypothetical protein